MSLKDDMTAFAASIRAKVEVQGMHSLDAAELETLWSFHGKRSHAENRMFVHDFGRAFQFCAHLSDDSEVAIFKDSD